MASGFDPRMVEDFPASGNPPLKECLARVSGSEHHSPCDLLIAVVAFRYGWVPGGQPGSGHKSITWLECLEAVKNGKEVLAFLVDEDAYWPLDLREECRAMTAVLDEAATAEQLSETAQEVQRNVAALREFKGWLGDGRTRATFSTADDLKCGILIALKDWADRHPSVRVEAPGDPGS